MPIITFWSNSEKTIGQTVSAVCAAITMAIEHNYKILLISADFDNTVVEECFGAQESNRDLLKTIIKTQQVNLESGINGLLKLADSNRITPEIIHDYTKIILKNRLEVLYSPTTNDRTESILMDRFKDIIINAGRYYDQVFVDLKKGMQYYQEIEILEISDVIISNIGQGTKYIEEFLNTNETKSLVEKDKVIWNICKCDKNSKYNAKNLTRTILKRKYVYETNYNTLVLEASQEGNITELLIRFRTLKKDNENWNFINNIRMLNEGILLKYQETQKRI